MSLGAAEWAALSLSLRVAGWATLIGLPLAYLVAWTLARRSFRGKALVKALVQMPLVLPPVVVGYLLLTLFGRNGPLGAALGTLGISVPFTSLAAGLAAGIMAFPLMVRACRLSIEALDSRLEAAARTLGAGAMRRFFTLSLPLSTPGLLAGATLGFARGFGEFGATIVFAANIPGETQTLPIAIYSALQSPGGDAVATRLVSISVAVALGAFLLSEWLERRTRARLSGQSR
ncbi:molybdate ABC transporter permease subunit [Roseobacter sp. HKCCA0434]|uniref:molybdate ABC transporter permease subunit n=1 Tax=Roseobacter sp. HKCCA0434 TaxID=3079297 RepID=UPI00290588A2|nr:molybdate ABC transporter permease subunit [Roseobacter sp. HKCCA0434]